MTVAQLKAVLDTMPQDAIVEFADIAGDTYSIGMVAVSEDERVELLEL